MVHSFPTRRSSDLAQGRHAMRPTPCSIVILALAARSEEHTSELQSHHPISYAVFCLKKKTTELARAHVGPQQGRRAQLPPRPHAQREADPRQLRAAARLRAPWAARRADGE